MLHPAKALRAHQGQAMSVVRVHACGSALHLSTADREYAMQCVCLPTCLQVQAAAPVRHAARPAQRPGAQWTRELFDGDLSPSVSQCQQPASAPEISYYAVVLRTNHVEPTWETHQPSRCFLHLCPHPTLPEYGQSHAGAQEQLVSQPFCPCLNP